MTVTRISVRARFILDGQPPQSFQRGEQQGDVHVPGWSRIRSAIKPGERPLNVVFSQPSNGGTRSPSPISAGVVRQGLPLQSYSPILHRWLKAPVPPRIARVQEIKTLGEGSDSNHLQAQESFFKKKKKLSGYELERGSSNVPEVSSIHSFVHHPHIFCTMLTPF